jgi:hypothetical protein
MVAPLPTRLLSMLPPVTCKQQQWHMQFSLLTFCKARQHDIMASGTCTVRAVVESSYCATISAVTVHNVVAVQDSHMALLGASSPCLA